MSAPCRAGGDSCSFLPHSIARVCTSVPGVARYSRVVPTRLMIVDDREDNLVALEVLLRRPGREIVCLQSGEQAVEEFGRRPATLALLDFKMPRMNGGETADALRTLDPRLPIIFVSAVAHDDPVQR